jgi:hypothetical protein
MPTRHALGGVNVSVGDAQLDDDSTLEFSLEVLRQEEQRRKLGDQQLHKRIDEQNRTLNRIDKRTRWQAWTQTVIILIVPLACAYLTVLLSNQRSADEAAAKKSGYESGQAAAQDEIRKQQQSTGQIALDNAERGADIALKKFEASHASQPIFVDPKKKRP